MNDKRSSHGSAPAADVAGIDDSRLLINVVQAVLGRAGGELWKVDPGEFRCGLTPPHGERRDRGWKLHVSATLLAAPVILARVAEVLVRDGCAFQLARGLDQLGGPLIAPVRPGSLVHYRCGVFGGPPVLDNDGGSSGPTAGPAAPTGKPAAVPVGDRTRSGAGASARPARPTARSGPGGSRQAPEPRGRHAAGAARDPPSRRPFPDARPNRRICGPARCTAIRYA
jgi:hypothetical protein